MILNFSDGSNSNWSVNDQDGNLLNDDSAQQTWHYRRIDLSSFAGKAISKISLNAEANTLQGNWAIYYTDIALVSADGTVRPIYNGQTSVSLTSSGSSGVTNISSTVNHLSGIMTRLRFHDRLLPPRPDRLGAVHERGERLPDLAGDVPPLRLRVQPADRDQRL